MSAIPAGYKQTEVGVIPEEWESSAMGDNCYWMSGGTPSRNNADYWRGNIPWISGSTLKSVEISTSDQFLTAEAVSSGSKMAPVDATLLLVRGSALHNEIRAGLVIAPVAFNQDVKALVPSATVEPKYLTYYILAHSEELLKLVSSAGNSAGVLDTGLVQNFKLLKPPLPEQRAIAAALSNMDALLAKLDQFIAKKRDLKQAAMQQLLTGQTRLPGFSGAWDSAVLGNLLTMKATYGIVTAGDFKSTGVPMMRGGDIKGGQVGHGLPFVSPEKNSEYSRTILKRDDVVIALVGYPGEAAKVPVRLEGANISRAVGLLRLNKLIASDYLVSYLNSPIGRRMVLAPSTGSAQLVVNLMALNKLEFPLPPLPEQTAIATVLSDMDADLAALEARRDKTRALKQGMMQELLTGRIRLI